MSLTEPVNERERLLIWAKENGPQSELLHLERAPGLKSYFEPFDNEGNAVEYGFERLLELKKQLLSMWAGDAAMEEVALIAAVASFKAKPAERIETGTAKADVAVVENDLVIPDFVYAF